MGFATLVWFELRTQRASLESMARDIATLVERDRERRSTPVVAPR